ncbi:MAG: CHAT domain-containing protein [Xenococcaceae cyanobacterium MO_188.B19]|nr:CHAT domain-containing protein [Xenococcaceae cyanobacterium MO_188.B19]
MKYLKKYLAFKFIIVSLLFIFAAITPIFINSNSLAQLSDNNLELIEQATKYYKGKQYSKAAIIWQKVAENFAQHGDKLNQAMAQGNISLSYQNMGEWSKAKLAIEQSLSIINSQKKSQERDSILAQSLDIQGKLQLELGQAEAALTSWEEANKLYNSVENRVKIINNQVNQAKALESLGFYPRACETLQQSLAFNNRTCDKFSIDNDLLQEEIKIFKQNFHQQSSQQLKNIKLKALITLGNNLRILGKLSEAKTLLETALDLAIYQTEAYYNATLALGNTNLILTKRNQVSNQTNPNTNRRYCDNIFDCYETVIKQNYFPLLQLQARLNYLSWSIDQKELDKINHLYLEQTEKLLNSLPLSQDTISNKIQFAQNLFCLSQSKTACLRQSETDMQLLLSDKNNLDLAAKSNITKNLNQQQVINLLNTASKEAETLGNKRLQSYAIGNLGRVYEQLGNLPIALDKTQQALELAQQMRAFDITYQWQWQKGRLLLKENSNNNQSQALNAYNQAIKSLQQIRGDLVALNRDLQFSFREEVEPVYRKTVSLILESADQAKQVGDNTKNQEQLRKARDIIESLQLAELDNFFQEACVDAKPQSIEAIDPKSAVIYSIILRDRLEIILSIPNQPLLHVTTKVSQTELEATVTNIRDFLVFPNTSSEQYLPSFQKLYNWLILPVAEQIKPETTSTLTFILDGVLRNIPMTILHDGKKYLIENYAIALTPGLQLLQPRPLTEKKLDTLAAGISQSRQVQIGNRDKTFAPLDNVTEELNQIAQLVSAETLENQSFQETNFKNKLQSSSFRIIHIASHGQFSSVAEETFILTWDGVINANELQDFLQNQNEPNRPIEMLALSACETAKGDKQAALGLAGVAIRAGARSTIASLWSVSDLGTVKLITQLYQQLVTNPTNKAEALRQAQLSLLQQDQFTHPYFWSAFVLVGNWL